MAVIATTLAGTPVANAGISALGGLEDYDTNFVDVTLQPTVGTWTKLDSPNPVVTQGELVTSGPFASITPRSGNVFLDLRTEAQYASGGDGADYHYSLNSLDFGGFDPTSMTSGTVALSFWTCPDTWSGDNGFFISEGIYQTTSLLNGNGDVLVSLGMYSLGNQNSPEVHYSIDGTTWLNTGLQADNGSWTEVELFVDLNNKTSQVGFTDANSNTFTSANMAWAAGITDTSVQTLNFKMDEGVGKNFFDDFSFTASPVAGVPEPTGLALAVLGFMAVTLPRKKRSVVHVSQVERTASTTGCQGRSNDGQRG